MTEYRSLSIDPTIDPKCDDALRQAPRLQPDTIDGQEWLPDAIYQAEAIPMLAAKAQRPQSPSHGFDHAEEPPRMDNGIETAD
jgi:hypothetical protein